jgi:hypothetical protein
MSRLIYERENKQEVLIGQPMNLIPLDRTKGVSRSFDRSLGWRTRC